MLLPVLLLLLSNVVLPTLSLLAPPGTVTARRGRGTLHPFPHDQSGRAAAGPALRRPLPHRLLQLLQSGAAAPPPHDLDLAAFFDPPHSSSASLLSPARIVDMLPPPPPPPSPSSAAAASSAPTYANPRPLRQELFSSPLIPALYERVLPPLWSAGLRIGGPDAEYEAAAPHLGRGDAALDLSCGTGFVARRVASSGKFRHVFALDYSREMLAECSATVERMGEAGRLPLSLIRGDAGSLPFRDGALDAVHWGAAMHCVPDAGLALREIYRVLRPGGRLYATTFLRPFPDVVFKFFTTDEMGDLARRAGFGRDGRAVDVEGRGVYGVLRATKAV